MPHRGGHNYDNDLRGVAEAIGEEMEASDRLLLSYSDASPLASASASALMTCTHEAIRRECDVAGGRRLLFALSAREKAMFYEPASEPWAYPSYRYVDEPYHP